MTVRVGTFNAENLFGRYNFRKNFEPTGGDGFSINDLAFDIYDEVEKQITAKAIRTLDADVLALQEVESLPVLDAFNSRYLAGMKYDHRIVVDSHDPRNIDVAVLSRHPITSVMSHRNERNAAKTAFLFSRDCLEVTLQVGKRELLLYVNHLKSMVGGRSQTMARRKEQAQRVAAIVTERWKARKYDGNFIVLGDFNDYIDEKTALTPLVKHPGLVNAVERREENDRWTHFYAGGNEYRQLDYILLSKGLATKNVGVPHILREGLPFRAERYTEKRLDNVGQDNPKASDHCPSAMDLELA
jgi:endonuclease/exonuclease/phosphatase family metal-dependent hydrolase